MQLRRRLAILQYRIVARVSINRRPLEATPRGDRLSKLSCRQLLPAYSSASGLSVETTGGDVIDDVLVQSSQDER